MSISIEQYRKCACRDRDAVWCFTVRYGGMDDMARSKAYQEALEQPCECICHQSDPSDPDDQDEYEGWGE